MRSVSMRIGPVILIAICTITAFTVAGGYSSYISTSTGDEVLIRGDNCAIIDTSGSVNVSLSTHVSFESRRHTRVANYAEQCYSGTNTGILDCSRYVVRNISGSSIDYNASCPFGSDICRKNESNIRLDSGYIDSNDYLGLNAPSGQRFSLRQVLSCAPLKTAGYNDTTVQYNKTFISYNYGETEVGSTTLNFTYAVPDLEAQYTQQFDLPGSMNYKLL